MELAQLGEGGSIARALQQMSNATVIDEKVLNKCLNEITRAQLQSDAQFKLVRDMQTNIKKFFNLDDLAAGHTTGARLFSNYIYISSCAFDQLKQNAIMAKIPFYGSYMESDPVKIAVEGVETFSKENCDLMIVDTSGCHKQEAALFEEMCHVSEATVFVLEFHAM
ncbi:hypothetical protein ACE6H2_026459 [Prunus campanulata]